MRASETINGSSLYNSENFTEIPTRPHPHTPPRQVPLFAAISNEQNRRVVCRKRYACRAGGRIQINGSRPPGPHRGRASATDSRRPAEATSRMDRAKRRVSNVRFLRGAPEPTPRALCAAAQPSQSRLTSLPSSVFQRPVAPPARETVRSSLAKRFGGSRKAEAERPPQRC